MGYKRIDLIIEAFSQTPHRKLIVIGEGPERRRLEEIAGENVEFVGFVEEAEVVRLMQNANAFVFAAEEDFGIVPVEAMACGCPVIAYGKGGVTESVNEGKTGVFFPQQTTQSLLAALDRFEQHSPLDELDRKALRQRAEQFSVEQFVERLTDCLRQQVRAKWPVSPSADEQPTDAADDKLIEAASMSQQYQPSPEDTAIAGTPTDR